MNLDPLKIVNSLLSGSRMNQENINAIPLSWIVYGGIIYDVKNVRDEITYTNYNDGDGIDSSKNSEPKQAVKHSYSNNSNIANINVNNVNWNSNHDAEIHQNTQNKDTPVSTEVTAANSNDDDNIPQLAVAITIETETNDDYETKCHNRGTASYGSRELSYQFDSNINHLKQRANSIDIISEDLDKKWGYAYNVKGLKMKLKPNFNVFEPSNDIEKMYLCKIIAYNLFTKYCQHRSLYEINICWNDRQCLFDKMHDLSKWMNTRDRNINVENEIDHLYHLFDSCIDEMYSLMTNSALAFRNSEVSILCIINLAFILIINNIKWFVQCNRSTKSCKHPSQVEHILIINCGV